MRNGVWLIAVAVLYVAGRACLAQDDRRPPMDNGNGWGDGKDHQGPPRDGGQPGDQRGPQPPQPPQPPMRPLTEEQMQQAMKFLEEWDPYRLKQMESMRERNPEEFMRNLGQAYFEMQRMEEMKKSQPEQYESMMKERKLDMRSFELGEKLRASKDEAEKKKLTEELTGVVSQLFDLREAHKAEEIQHLEDRLKHLRDDVEKRRKNKDAIIDRRIKELSGDLDDDHW